MTPFLIVTDLDATLLGNDPYLEEFNSLFNEHCRRNKSKLVYATGRSLHLYKELESQEVDLLVPDRLITSVGSEIYTVDKQDRTNKQIDDEWSSHVSANWNVETVWEITSEYGQLIRQPETEQGPYKLSFSLDSRYKSILEELEQRLNNNETIEAQVIYSSNIDVDVLPARSGKGNALRYVREKLSIPCDRTVACGDSGNDIALFTDTSIYGIIVGNAKKELEDWYWENTRDNLYLAQGNSAAGIIEGLRHFGWL
jgi:sucrose-6-phosphatase